MTVGYPDYTRLSLDGGVQLYGTNNTAPENTQLFKGYVGNWPYVDLALSMGANNDFYQFAMYYYTDSTFTTQVGTRIAVRQSGCFANVQYGNLSDWLYFFYVSKTGNPFTGTNLSLFGTTGAQRNFQLASNDVPIFLFSGQVALSSNVNEIVQHITPGPGNLHWYTTATSWDINVQLYNYGAGNFQTVRVLSNGVESNHGTIPLAMLDCPYQFNLVNNDTSNRTFIIMWEPL